MAQTNLRELLVTDLVHAPETDASPPDGEVIPMMGKDLAIYTKGVDVPVYVVGEGGDSIVEVSKPRNVIVPLVRYALGDAGEAAVQERIVALIETAANPSGSSVTKLRMENIEKHLCKTLRKPLYAILADEAAVEQLAKAMPRVAMFVSPLPLGRRVYGLPDPKFLGRIAVGAATQGIMVHGRPVLVEAVIDGVPAVELATPRDIGRPQAAH